jgi:hypothetical protein
MYKFAAKDVKQFFKACRCLDMKLTPYHRHIDFVGDQMQYTAGMTTIAITGSSDPSDVPCWLLADAFPSVKNPDGIITVEYDRQKGAEIRWTDHGIPHNDFCALESGCFESTAEPIPLPSGYEESATILSDLSMCHNYTDKYSSKYARVYIFIDNSGTAVALDGRRMITVDLGRTFKFKQSANLSAKNINGIMIPRMSFLPNSGMAKIWSDDSVLIIDAGGFRVRCKGEDGKFPNWKGVIPSGFCTECSLLDSDRKQIVSKVPALPGVSKDVAGLYLYFGQDGLAIDNQGNTPDEKVTRLLLTRSVSKRQETVLFDYRFLTEALAFPVDKIQVSDAGSSLIFSGNRFRVICMTITFKPSDKSDIGTVINIPSSNGDLTPDNSKDGSAQASKDVVFMAKKTAVRKIAVNT